MNAVIDEDLHRSFIKVLASLGFSPMDIRDTGLRGATDEAIFLFSQKHKAVLFSADLGFSNTLVYRVASHYGIVILRYPNELSNIEINKEVAVLLSNLTPNDYPGSLIILSPGKLRIRRKQ